MVQEGRDEGRRLVIKKNCNAGWREPWQVAHEEGRRDGASHKAKGRAEAELTSYGGAEGKGSRKGTKRILKGVRGRNETALQKFGRFLKEEVRARFTKW